jgi:hypothetical protein
MKALENKLIDNVENKILATGLKMISREKNDQEIARVLNRARYYDRQLDQDYMFANGDLKKVLRIKRKRAEVNLALMSVLMKLMVNQG